MYEIWLVINILWEIALGIWPLLVAAGLAWIALTAWALRRARGRWRAALPVALAAAAVVAVLTFLAVPGLTRSSLGELRYWVDWANLAGIAGGFGGATLAFAWPLAALLRATVGGAGPSVPA